MYTFRKIVNILLILILVLGAGLSIFLFVQNYKLIQSSDQLETEVKHMQKEIEGIRSFLKGKAGDMPFIITDIQYTDRESDADDYFYEIKIYPCSSLRFRACFVPLEEVEDMWLTFELFDKNGKSVYPRQNGVTHIKFNSMKTGWISLTNEVCWDGDWMPGVYYYKIKYKDQVIATKKVIIHEDDVKPAPQFTENDSDVWF